MQRYDKILERSQNEHWLTLIDTVKSSVIIPDGEYHKGKHALCNKQILWLVVRDIYMLFEEQVFILGLPDTPDVMVKVRLFFDEEENLHELLQRISEKVEYLSALDYQEILEKSA